MKKVAALDSGTRTSQFNLLNICLHLYLYYLLMFISHGAKLKGALLLFFSLLLRYGTLDHKESILLRE